MQDRGCDAIDLTRLVQDLQLDTLNAAIDQLCFIDPTRTGNEREVGIVNDFHKVSGGNVHRITFYLLCATLIMICATVIIAWFVLIFYRIVIIVDYALPVLRCAVLRIHRIGADGIAAGHE